MATGLGEGKQVYLHLKIGLVPHPACVEGLVNNSINTCTFTFLYP